MQSSDGRKNVSLAWICPTYGIGIHRLIYESHLACIAKLSNIGVDVKQIIVSNKIGLAQAENAFVESVLEHKPDYSFWTEQDMLLPSHAVEKLLETAINFEKNIVSGVYFLRGNGQPCLYKKLLSSTEDRFKYAHTPMMNFPRKGIFKVEACGVGCVIIKTTALEKLSFPYFADIPGECGNDMHFYHKVREADIEVWVDPGVICDQIDEDEPKRWGESEYQEWMKTKESKAGFIYGANPDSL